VVVPIARRHTWPTVKQFAKALAERFAEQMPDLYVATMRKARRKGRIFIDHFRNELTASAVVPYSPRAREGAPVAWPVTWEALATTESANVVSLKGAGERLKGRDPWENYERTRQGLAARALRALGVEN
jgi:bifunctional non-homologous end joining protein LigD